MASHCGRLDLQCSSFYDLKSFERLRNQIGEAVQVCGKLNVVTINGGGFVPSFVGLATDAVVYLTDRMEFMMLPELLQNKNLTVYTFMMEIDLRELNPWVESVDWTRIHVGHLIMRGLPSLIENYARYYAYFKKGSQHVYQELDPELNVSWLAQVGVDQVVIPYVEYNLRHELRELPPGLVARHLDTLIQMKDSWNEHAVAALQSGDMLAGAVTGLRAVLDDALSGSIQNPALGPQLYHQFLGNDRFFVPWLRFLQREHPQFCAFEGAMFFYSEGTPEAPTAPFRVGENLNFLTEFSQIARQSGTWFQVMNGVLGVNDNLSEAMYKCNQRYLVGIMWIWAEFHHINAVIIDRLTGTITRFEPNGRHSVIGGKHLDTLFQKFVADYPQRFDKYVAPNDFCALEGPQSLADREEYHDFEERRKGVKDRGWCGVISLMFIHYRLAHPEKSDRDVEEMMSSKSGGQLAVEIRSYANAIVSKA